VLVGSSERKKKGGEETEGWNAESDSRGLGLKSLITRSGLLSGGIGIRRAVFNRLLTRIGKQTI